MVWSVGHPRPHGDEPTQVLEGREHRPVDGELLDSFARRTLAGSCRSYERVADPTTAASSRRTGDARRGGREGMPEHFLGVVDQHEAELFPELLRYVFDIALVSAGQDHLADA